MDLARLLETLQRNQIELVEVRGLPSEKKTVYVLAADLPAFPYGPGHRRWYPLAIDDGQTHISREEIEAILRHFHHLQLDLFGDEATAAGIPR